MIFMYPKFARSERIADGVIHAIGVTLALAGAVTLIVFAALWSEGVTIAAISIYGAALMLTFCASACYHMTPWERIRPALRKLDHAAIYIKIAGTYTPFVAMIGTAFAWVILAIVWALAIIGAVAKLFFWRDPGKMALALYIAMGWLAVALAWPMIQTLPASASILVAVGGLLYTIGTLFFARDKLKFANAIWHGFVLAASVCFFVAISLGMTQIAA